MKKYKVIKNKPKVFKDVKGNKVTVPNSTEYSVHFQGDKHDICVCTIPNYFKYPEGIAEGIASLLNSDKYILPLDI